MMRRRWWGVMGSVAAAGVLTAAPGGAATPAPVAGPVAAGVEHSVVGDGPNAVGLVVDTGERVVQVCVRFSESTLTGAEVLRRAGVDPVFAAMGPGLAVCSLCGTGCPGDGSCLTCQEPNYWSYWNAAPGATGFGYAALGAAATRLRSGAIDGWRWGPGGVPPPFPAFASLCPGVEVAGTPGTPLATTLAPVPATTTPSPPATAAGAVPPTAPPAASVVSSPAVADPRAPAPPAVAPAPSAPAPGPAEAPSSSTVAAAAPAPGPAGTPAPGPAGTPAPGPVPTAGDALPPGDQAAGAPPTVGGSGQGAVAGTLAGVAVLVAALGGVAAVAWRRQRS